MSPRKEDITTGENVLLWLVRNAAEAVESYTLAQPTKAVIGRRNFASTQPDQRMEVNPRLLSPIPEGESHDEDTTPLLDKLGWADAHGTDVARLEDAIARRLLTSRSGLAAGENDFLAEFSSDEHSLLGEKGLQQMVNEWARNGLIAGGAFVEEIDNEGNPQFIEHWKIFLPDYSNPTNPYGDAPHRILAHWNWIIPNAHHDRVGKPWTAASLKAEIKDGTAATLSIGDIILLSGDLIEKFEDFKNAASPNWRSGPVNIMSGYEQLEPFAVTSFRLLQFPRKGMDRLNDVRLLERNQSDYNGLRDEIRRGDPYWNRTKAIVEYLKKARGSTGCSELTVLSRMLRRETTTLGTMNMVTPWVSQDSVRTLVSQLDAGDVSKSEAQKLGLDWNTFRNRGFDLDMMQVVLSNGQYAALALNNASHFSPENWKRFETAHEAALHQVDKVMQNPFVVVDQAPIPADAIAQTAYGLHFLTDAFSAGHMRVPRAKLGQRGALLAKVMHDVDGKIGLWVENGFGKIWRAFGDGFLETRSKWQNDLMARISKASPEAKSLDATNMSRCMVAMASAMKQLHYQAQKYFSDSKTAPFQAALHSQRGDVHGLYGDGLASGTPGDPAKGRDDWIAMDIPAKLTFLRKHQPFPRASSSDWLTSTTYANLPELIAANGSINRSIYEWERHLTQGYNDRMIRVAGVGDVVDITQLFQLARNMPAGATSWYGNREEGIDLLLRTLPERGWNPLGLD